MHRSIRAAASAVAILAISLTAAFAAPTSVGARGRPAASTLLDGVAGHPEGLAEAMAAAEYNAMRVGLIDPAKAPDAMNEAGAVAARIRTAAGALGRSWKELGPKPYVTNDAAYSDLYGGTPTLGWINVAGRVTTLAVDPSDRSGKTLWMGAAAGGVWVTRNGGDKWTQVWDAKETLSIGAIAIDPKRPKNIYIGTGEGNLGGGTMFRGVGVYRSTNGGKSFARVARNA